MTTPIDSDSLARASARAVEVTHRRVAALRRRCPLAPPAIIKLWDRLESWQGDRAEILEIRRDASAAYDAAGVGDGYMAISAYYLADAAANGDRAAYACSTPDSTAIWSSLLADGREVAS